jgi:hypothetical protein
MSSAVLDCDLDFEEEYDSGIEDQNNSITNFLCDIKPIIIKIIGNYFSNKKICDSRVLDLPNYADIVLRTTVSDGVLKAYKVMEQNGFLSDGSRSNNRDISEDIRYMIDLIRSIQRTVPQEFVGGMILLHLELVEGLKVW